MELDGYAYVSGIMRRMLILSETPGLKRIDTVCGAYYPTRRGGEAQEIVGLLRGYLGTTYLGPTPSHT